MLKKRYVRKQFLSIIYISIYLSHIILYSNIKDYTMSIQVFQHRINIFKNSLEFEIEILKNFFLIVEIFLIPKLNRSQGIEGISSIPTYLSKKRFKRIETRPNTSEWTFAQFIRIWIEIIYWIRKQSYTKKKGTGNFDTF